MDQKIDSKLLKFQFLRASSLKSYKVIKQPFKCAHWIIKIYKILPETTKLYNCHQAIFEQVGKELCQKSCIQYSLCADAMSYTLSQGFDDGTGAKQDSLCTADYLQIPGNFFWFSLWIHA